MIRGIKNIVLIMGTLIMCVGCTSIAHFTYNSQERVTPPIKSKTKIDVNLTIIGEIVPPTLKATIKNDLHDNVFPNPESSIPELYVYVDIELIKASEPWGILWFPFIVFGAPAKKDVRTAKVELKVLDKEKRFIAKYSAHNKMNTWSGFLWVERPSDIYSSEFNLTVSKAMDEIKRQIEGEREKILSSLDRSPPPPKQKKKIAKKMKEEPPEIIEEPEIKDKIVRKVNAYTVEAFENPIPNPKGREIFIDLKTFLKEDLKYFITGYYRYNTRENAQKLKTLIEHYRKEIGITKILPEELESSVKVEEILKGLYREAGKLFKKYATEEDYGNLQIEITGYADERPYYATYAEETVEFDNADYFFPSRYIVVERGSKIDNKKLSQLRAYYTMVDLKKLFMNDKNFLKLIEQNRVSFKIFGAGVDDSPGITYAEAKRATITIRELNHPQ
ncbi:MAG: hypothetical protein ACMUJM_14515 [bacterium]